VAAAAVTGLLVFVVTDGYDAGAVSVGVIYACTAVGAIGGPALVPRLVRRLATGRTFLLGVGVTGVGAACIGLVRVPPGGAAGATLAIAGIGILNVTQFTLRQERTPDHLLGRVSGVLRSGFFLAFAVGGFGTGLLADVAGIFNAQLAVGGAVLAVALAGALTPLSRT
jgi:MFS family permease